MKTSARRLAKVAALFSTDFHIRGFCWTFRVVTRARTGARSLGLGSWVRSMSTRRLRTVSAVFKLSDCGNGAELDSFAFVKNHRFITFRQLSPSMRRPVRIKSNELGPSPSLLMCICGSLSPEFLRPGCNPTKHRPSHMEGLGVRIRSFVLALLHYVVHDRNCRAEN